MKILLALVCIFVSTYAKNIKDFKAKNFEILMTKTIHTDGNLEPSGLVKLADDIIIVSDEGSICNLTKSFCRTPRKGADFEGVTVSKNGEIFVVQEGKDNILKLNSNYEITNTYNVPRTFNGKTVLARKGNGLESLTYINEDENFYYFYTANQSKSFKGEDRSGLLMVSVNKTTDEVKILNYLPLRIKDISALHFSQQYKSLFLVSDTKNKLFVFDSCLNLKTVYNLPGKDQEGIFIQDDTLYIAQDKGDILIIKVAPNTFLVNHCK